MNDEDLKRRELYERVSRHHDVDLDFERPGACFTVRHWDGMDGCWCDLPEATAVAAGVALEVWTKHTRDGTKGTSFAEIDYYAIFPADTRMAWDGGPGREMFRGDDAPEPRGENLHVALPLEEETGLVSDEVPSPLGRAASITIHGCDKLDTTEERYRALQLALSALGVLVQSMNEKDGLQAMTYDVQPPGGRPIRYRISVGQSPPLMRLALIDRGSCASPNDAGRESAETETEPEEEG